MKDHYDYIVVGAGSAGCALAYRLSADPAVSVALIESGPPDTSPFVHMPRGIGVILNPGSKLIWEYDVATGGNGPTERWYRGRTLGGSSSVNGMIYMRGAPLDYDRWEAMGCEGWGWKDVGAKFVELEDHDQGAAEWRGVGGPQRITTHPAGDPLCEAILDAGVEMGIDRVADVNNIEAVRKGGLGYQPTTRDGTKRASSAAGFLKAAKGRANLDVLTETDVLRVEFTGKRATAVRVLGKGKNAPGERSIHANREIILSCGAIETPKLLQLSGIGPASLLQSLGIDVVVDSPDVGQNLREHRHADLTLRVRSHSQNKDLSGWRAGLSLLRYFITGKGPMSHAAHEIGGFAKSTPDQEHADLQFGLMTVSAVPGPDGKIGLSPYPGITFVTYFTRPESQGEVKIVSKDPSVAPYVDAKHLTCDIDREKFIGAVRWNRRLAAMPALKDWVIEEALPGKSVETDEEILANAMSFSGTCFHTAGTARMGVDPKAVLDPRLRVRGVEGLRVADTSVMPTLVSGNTNGPAMMVGLRAADFIQEDNKA